MSNAVINDLSGLELGFPFETRTRFPVAVVKAYSGTSVAMSLVDHDFKSYSILMPVRTRTEEQTFLDFYDDHSGELDTFLFLDPKKNFVSRTSIGTGDTVEDVFQLKDAKGRSRFEIQQTPVDAKIWVNNVLQTTPGQYSIVYYSDGKVTFVAPPGMGLDIEAEFYYWRRVRFRTAPMPTTEEGNNNITLAFEIEEVLP